MMYPMYQSPYPSPIVSPEGRRCLGGPELIAALEKAINGEYNATRYYSKLAELAPTEEAQRIILDVILDERQDHLQTFVRIYMRLTGRRPPLKPGPLPTSYLEGIQFAIRDELETVKFYQDIAANACDPVISKIFLYDSFDEQRHATWFTYLWLQYLTMHTMRVDPT